uniref:Short-chain dehydrogenase/reductase 3 n=1 Tax=Caenorhabditis japonica TaxID=281687 RepID=A0A8R1HTJ1_CAEJA
MASAILILKLLQIYLSSIFKNILPYSLLPKKDLNGKKVLITGAASGLGRLLALQIAARGAHLILWDVNEQALEEVKNEIEKDGGQAHCYQVDLCDAKKIVQVGGKVLEEHGKVDILVNNAGVATAKLVLESSVEEIERSFAVNVKAHFYTVQQFLPAMLEEDDGHIVTIASVAGKMASAGLADYTATKHAVVGFHDSLVAEILESEKHGVKTTLVCPYYVHTAMFNASGARTRLPTLFPILEPEYVVKKIVEAIETEQEYLVTPRSFYWLLPGTQLLPYKAQKIFGELFGLIQSLDRFH